MNEHARKIIAAIELHRLNFMVKATPLGALLPELRGWVTETEMRLAALESKSAETKK